MVALRSVLTLQTLGVPTKAIEAMKMYTLSRGAEVCGAKCKRERLGEQAYNTHSGAWPWQLLLGKASLKGYWLCVFYMATELPSL